MPISRYRGHDDRLTPEPNGEGPPAPWPGSTYIAVAILIALAGGVVAALAEEPELVWPFAVVAGVIGQIGIIAVGVEVALRHRYYMEAKDIY